MQTRSPSRRSRHKCRVTAKPKYIAPTCIDSGDDIVDVGHSEVAAGKAVQLIHEGKGDLLMKGSLHTDELMRAVTSSGTGSRTARRISHIVVVDVPSHAEALLIADA